MSASTVDTRPPLTHRRALVLAAIYVHWADHGYAPTISEIGRLAGLASKGTVHDHLRLLVDHGYVEQLPGVMRSIRIKDHPLTHAGDGDGAPISSPLAPSPAGPALSTSVPAGSSPVPGVPDRTPGTREATT